MRSPVTPNLHDEQADIRGVCAFVAAMLEKLSEKRDEGRGGWHDPKICSTIYLRELLTEHAEKGDPVDIANFAMMVWNRQRQKRKPT